MSTDIIAQYHMLYHIHIWYDIEYDIIYDIIYIITYDIIYDIRYDIIYNIMQMVPWLYHNYKCHQRGHVKYMLVNLYIMTWVCTSTYQYVPCSLIYFWECFFVSYDCLKQYCVFVTCMQWCSNTEWVPLYVSNMHDFVLVHTQYILVCTLMFHIY